MHSTSLFAMTLVLAAQPGGEAPRSLSDDHVKISEANVSLIDEVEVPARQAGVIGSLQLPDGTPVQEGLAVSEGQLLGKLEDDEAVARQRASQLDHQVAKAEASKSRMAIEAAEKTMEVAEAEVAESEAVNERSPRAVPRQQLRRQRLTVERATSEAKVARSEAKTAELTIEAREAQMDVAGINLEMHKIKSPLDGEVVSVYRHVGEWVNPGDPLMRVLRLDRLRVEGHLKLDDYLREEVSGQPVTVEVRLPRGRVEQFQGVVTFVSPLVDSIGEYRVWCEVDNRKANGFWVLLPGMDAEMTIALKQSQLASTE